MTPSREAWSFSVGFLPHKVTVYERLDRDGTLYLMWRAGGNWDRRSLKRGLRTPRGKIDEAVKAWAKEQAVQHYARLVSGLSESEQLVIAPLTLADGLKRAIDPETGKYPTATAHRKEVGREMERAMRWLGSDTVWADVKRKDLRRLWRGRIQELRGDKRVGMRGAEITVQRLLAVAQWLRDEEAIPAGACIAPRTWRTELKADWIELTGARGEPKPARPRYTLEESRALLRVAASLDPRYALLLALGAELRGGQVVRARRPDLDLEHATFTVFARGRKRGIVVELTPGQVRAFREATETGYLRDLEANAADYPLFPAGQMPGSRKGNPVATVDRHREARPMDMSAMRAWHRLAEERCEITYMKGRALYGLRRAGVDAAKALKISREGLKAHGGWSDTQVPDTIYADEEQLYARQEAREIRKKIRGEED